MKSSTLFVGVCLVFFSLSGINCAATYEIKKVSELQECQGRYPIRALTVDSLLYTFEDFSYTYSDLTGRGTLTQSGVTTPFEGSVPFSRIAFIEGQETSFWKGVWVLPMLAGTYAGLQMVFSEKSHFDIHRIEPTSVSCPSVYSFDGTAYRLEAEAFGTSVFRELEGETYHVLSSLIPVNGRLNVRVANERPETHLLNSVHLFVGDARDASSCVLDVENVLWPVLNPRSPLSARDHADKDILSALAKKDRRYWSSDLAHTTPLSGFHDELRTDFEVPAGVTDATLIIDAIITNVFTEAFRVAGSVLGDATMQFYDALEHDPQLQNSIREWIRDCSLKIEVEEGDGWKEVALVAPEATVAPFSRAIRIPNLDRRGGLLRVRLSSLTDVWRIDAVSIDFSPVKQIPLHPLEMVSVTARDRENWKAALEWSDSSYALLLPPNFLDVTFGGPFPEGIKKPVYVFSARGYIYEWLPSSPHSDSTLITESMSSSSRVELFKLLIQHKDLFLPPIYAHWRKENSSNPTQNP